RNDGLALQAGVHDDHVGADLDHPADQNRARLDLLAGEALFEQLCKTFSHGLSPGPLAARWPSSAIPTARGWSMKPRIPRGRIRHGPGRESVQASSTAGRASSLPCVPSGIDILTNLPVNGPPV